MLLLVLDGGTVSAVGSSQCRLITMKVLRISDCWVLNPNGIFIITLPTKAQEHHTRRGGKNVRTKGRGGELRNAVFQMWHGHHSHQLTEAMNTCQDQAFQHSTTDEGRTPPLAEEVFAVNSYGGQGGEGVCVLFFLRVVVAGMVFMLWWMVSHSLESRYH